MKPEIKESLDAYAATGRPTGGFLRACLETDLAQAMGRADLGNRADLFDIVRYIYNELPGPCWGSVAKVGTWLKQKAEERARSHEGP